MGFYVSTSQVFAGSDVLLATNPGGQLVANQSSYRLAYPVVPVATSAGSY